MAQEWWRGAVIYQIYPRSYQDTTGSGVGDLPGITQRLEHVARLGVDGIWLSPFFTSPMADFGYDVADYRGIDPMFGTLEDFDRLVARAHELGLKVVIDQVYGHSSDRHPWFVESASSRDNPKADWYVWADPRPDGTPPSNWLSVFGGNAWTWNSRRRQYYLHHFLKEQPALNIHNPEVMEQVKSDLRFWMDRGVDGVRLDAIRHASHNPDLRDNPPRKLPKGLPHGLPGNTYGMQQQSASQIDDPILYRLAQELRSVLDDYPDRFAVAEVGGDNQLEIAARLTDGPELLHTAYTFEFLRQEEGGAITPAMVRDALETWEDQPGASWPSWAFSNHDVVRTASRSGEALSPDGFPQLAMAMLLSLRGTAFIYQGEELGLTEVEVPFERLQDPFGIAMWPDYKGRDGCRTPMVWEETGPACGFSNTGDTWLPIPGDHHKLAVTRQEEDKDSMLSFTRNFLRWRKQHPALLTGSIEFLDLPEPVLGFVREEGGEKLLCLFNLSASEQRVPLFNMLVTDIHGQDQTGLTGRVDGDNAVLPAWAGLIVGSE
ncbi:MAG: alpha-glucosidase family protein [Alphaproteobacteria bacterium]